MPDAISTRGQNLPHLLHNLNSPIAWEARPSPSPRRISYRRTFGPSVGAPPATAPLPDAERGPSPAPPEASPVIMQMPPRKPRRAPTRPNVSGDGRGIDLDAEWAYEAPEPPQNFPLNRNLAHLPELSREPTRRGSFPSVLMTPQMRSQRLIGNSNPRYRWEQYYKTDEELKQMKKPLRQYYERNNYLVQQYLYIDRLLDSSLPHHLIQDYQSQADLTRLAEEESTSSPATPDSVEAGKADGTSVTWYGSNGAGSKKKRVRRTKDIYRITDEETPLLEGAVPKSGGGAKDAVPPAPPSALPAFIPEEEDGDAERIVSVAIYLNLAANTLLLALKIVVTILTSSLSVLASLVDAALDFLSTAIVWVTSRLISKSDEDIQGFPVGRRRLEPIGVLVFSVIMITSFVQVGIEAINRLTGRDHSVVQLSVSALVIMASTVVVKGLCWLWCRLIRNSSVQALAQDAVTDVVFNTFSIIFPLIGYYADFWWLDPLGGLLLSLYVIFSWSFTSREHILNLTGRAASKDERNILLYLTMRFANTIESIQSLAAYHAGDKINVEVDIVLDENMSLKDSHDLSESLQYVLESVPGVERAFVHADYRSENIPNHMRQ